MWAQDVEQAVLLEDGDGIRSERDRHIVAGHLVTGEQARVTARAGDLRGDECGGTSADHEQSGFDADPGHPDQNTARGLTGLPVTPWKRIGASANWNSQRPSRAQVSARSSSWQLSMSHRPMATMPIMWMGMVTVL